MLVVEKNPKVGLKSCGGGLSTKAVRELRALGVPAQTGLDLVADASFRAEDPIAGIRSMRRSAPLVPSLGPICENERW